MLKAPALMNTQTVARITEEWVVAGEGIVIYPHHYTSDL
jgi:hypothetical protein